MLTHSVGNSIGHMMAVTVRLKPIDLLHQVPKRMTSGASGYDLCAALAAPVEIAPLARALIPCGFAIAIPEGYEGVVRPRSGLAVKHGVTVLNSPGTIDSDYRGEVKVLLVNLGAAPYVVQPQERVAQLVIQAVASACFEVVEELEPSTRAGGGFGSTGR